MNSSNPWSVVPAAVANAMAAALSIALPLLLALGVRAMWNQDAKPIFEAIESIAVVIGVVVSVGVYIHGVRVRQSELQRSHAETLLQRAFELFEQSCLPGNMIPAADQHLWLTVARMLMKADSLSSELRDPDFVLYKLSRSYWRTRLLALFPQEGDGWPIHYWAQSFTSIGVCHEDDRFPIHPASIRAIQKFLEWPNDPDPLKGFPPYSDDEIDHMGAFGPRSLAEYLEARRASGNNEATPAELEIWRNKFRESQQDANYPHRWREHRPRDGVVH